MTAAKTSAKSKAKKPIPAPVIPADERKTKRRVDYRTRLSEADEARFQAWVAETGYKFVDGPTTNYDARGYWWALDHGQTPAEEQFRTPHHEFWRGGK